MPLWPTTSFAAFLVSPASDVPSWCSDDMTHSLPWRQYSTLPVYVARVQCTSRAFNRFFAYNYYKFTATLKLFTTLWRLWCRELNVVSGAKTQIELPFNCALEIVLLNLFSFSFLFYLPSSSLKTRSFNSLQFTAQIWCYNCKDP